MPENHDEVKSKSEREWSKIQIDTMKPSQNLKTPISSGLDHIRPQLRKSPLVRPRIAICMIHIQVHQPRARVEFGEDCFDTEVVSAFWRSLYSLDDYVADDGLGNREPRQ